MFQLFDRLGLKRSLAIAFGAVLVLCLGATAMVVRAAVRGELEEGLRRRAAAQARVLAGRIALPLAPGEDPRAAGEVEAAIASDDDAFALVLRADGSLLARNVRPAYQAAAARALEEHARHPETPFVSAGGAYAWFEPLGPARQGSSPEARPVGFAVHGLSASLLEDQTERLRLPVLVMLVLSGLILVACASFFAQRLIVRPLAEMTQAAESVSACDLGARAKKGSDDELGRLAGAVNRIGENLAATVSRLNGVSSVVGQVIERMGRTGAKVAEGTGTVSARVAETGASMSEMITSLKGIADNVEVLAQSADESSSSILEMAATNTEVAENIQALAASVEETTAAIEHMTKSIKEVATSIEELSATAEETSSAMNEMDVSISHVETNANETAKLSEQAMKDAELSTEALSRTLAGIGRIKDSSKEAASVIDSLGRKIGTIGNILNVIDEVAEQTNLLALNAAILAAQSGEHGKGFAVVADEIKDLAERTGASTKEIAELIRSVQDESANAVAAMDRGVKNVEEGVRLGQEAEAALKKIQASSVKSTQMVKAIARATLEQARGSKQVTTAFNRIAETVQQIATATAEQARGSEQIMKSAEKMKIITKHVERSSQEQARGSKQITKAMESISEMVNHLNRAQKDQTKGSESVMGAVEQIRKVAEAQTHAVNELEASIADLAAQAEVLKTEVGRFRV